MPHTARQCHCVVMVVVAVVCCRKRVAKRSSWHPATRGFQMKDLPLGGQSDVSPQCVILARKAPLPR
jgi:hypothetical protein